MVFLIAGLKKNHILRQRGLGLHLALDSFSVRIFDIETYNLLNAKEGDHEIRRWQVFNFFGAKNYKAACTCDSTIKSVNYLDITQLLSDRSAQIRNLCSSQNETFLYNF